MDAMSTPLSELQMERDDMRLILSVDAPDMPLKAQGNLAQTEQGTL